MFGKIDLTGGSYSIYPSPSTQIPPTIRSCSHDDVIQAVSISPRNPRLAFHLIVIRPSDLLLYRQVQDPVVVDDPGDPALALSVLSKLWPELSFLGRCAAHEIQILRCAGLRIIALSILLRRRSYGRSTSFVKLANASVLSNNIFVGSEATSDTHSAINGVASQQTAFVGFGTSYGISQLVTSNVVLVVLFHEKIVRVQPGILGEALIYVVQRQYCRAVGQ